MQHSEDILKKAVYLLLAVSIVFIGSGCASNKVINGIEYNTYGLLDASENKNPNIRYNVVWGNVIWGTVLLPTIIGPIYFWGFSMWEPAGVETGIPGQVIR